MINLKQKKQELVDEFNRNQQTIQQLANRNQQILGQLSLLEELEKETPKEAEKKEETK